MFLFIGDDWLSTEAEKYKKLIVDKIGPLITRPIVIGALPTFLTDIDASLLVERKRAWFLLFDIHRVFLYDDDFSEADARINDISLFVKDVTTVNHFKAISAYSKNHPTVPTGFDRVLSILPLFLRQDSPGWVTDFNTVTGVINYTRASSHPMSKTDSSYFASETLLINHLQVGYTGRRLNVQKLEPDDSSESNIIRLSDLRINDLSIPVGRSMVVWREGEDKFICGGKSTAVEGAELVSICESLERFQVMYRPQRTKLIKNSYKELGEKAVNPDNLFFNTRSKVFDPEEPFYWTEAFELNSGNRKFVPAQEVWFDTALMKDEKIWITNTTNGCAVGGSFEEALLFAILEATERDSFLTCWYLRKPCRKIEFHSLVHEQLHILLSKLRYFKPDYEITFFDLKNDLNIPSVLATAVRVSSSGPKFFCAVASALNYASAAFSALKDIQNLLSFPPTLEQLKRFERLSEDQTKISDPEDHQGIYTLDSMFDKVNFFDAGKIIDRDEMEHFDLTKERKKDYDAKSIIMKLEDNCREAGVNLYCCDISHQSLRKKNLYCVKIMGEHLFPIWYGYHNSRITVNKRLKKLSNLEIGKTISNLKDINTEIHPFG